MAAPNRLCLAWLAPLILCSSLGCQSGAVGPEPSSAFASASEEQAHFFKPNLELTSAIDAYAVRRPELTSLVDLQIAAMVKEVKLHGRGELDRRALEATAPASRRGTRKEELVRLVTAAALLASYLDLERGPTQLGKAAISALRTELGEDAEYRELDSDSSAAPGDLVPELREGVATLWVPHLEGDIALRIFAMISQWNGSDPSPRAIVLDLSECEYGTPEVAASVISAFAPGARGFQIVQRDPGQGVVRSAWRATKRPNSATALQGARLFVVTSARTGSVCEAVVDTLRAQRKARVIGSVTKGDGRVMSYQPLLAHRAWFAFTVADLIGSDGTRLRERPIVPDACQGATEIESVRERTLEAFRAQCGTPAREVQKQALLDYVKAMLESAAEPAPDSSPPLKYGEKET